jgi:putative ABC transport system ATP-binding protein
MNSNKKMMAPSDEKAKGEASAISQGKDAAILQATSDGNAREVNLQIEDVYRIFQQGPLEVVALKGINFKVYAGEIIVIMGPSGSGKTTLLNCMSGLDRPSAGNILVRGYDIAKMNDIGIQKILQNEIGIVFQFFNLVPSLTAAGNIELPMQIADRSAKYRNERVEELIKLVNLEERAHHRPFTLSGGEKQRVAIAMAFANDPRVILADEPTGNIDSVTSEKIMQIFADFIKQYPEKSIVIVTHNPALRKIADRTLIIKDGQIIRELGKIDAVQQENLTQNGIMAGTQAPTSPEDHEVHQILHGQSGDEVERILNPVNRYMEYAQVKQCRHCESSNIQKIIDHDAGHFTFRNGHLVTRIAIHCDDCHQMYFETVSVKEMELKL